MTGRAMLVGAVAGGLMTATLAPVSAIGSTEAPRVELAPAYVCDPVGCGELVTVRLEVFEDGSGVLDGRPFCYAGDLCDDSAEGRFGTVGAEAVTR